MLHRRVEIEKQDFRKDFSMEGIISFIGCSAIQDNPESQRLWVGISITKKLSGVDCYKQSA
jgi:hypothetical protein